MNNGNENDCKHVFGSWKEGRAADIYRYCSYCDYKQTRKEFNELLNLKRIDFKKPQIVKTNIKTMHIDMFWG
jgi:hypothetical protein